MTFDNLIALHKMLWPDTNLEQQIKKFEEEKNEFRNASGTDDDIFELADMVIVSAGIARFNYMKGIRMLVYTINNAEFSVGDIWQAVDKKMEKNRRRVWEKHNGMYQHKAGIED